MYLKNLLLFKSKEEKKTPLVAKKNVLLKAKKKFVFKCTLNELFYKNFLVVMVCFVAKVFFLLLLGLMKN